VHLQLLTPPTAKALVSWLGGIVIALLTPAATGHTMMPETGLLGGASGLLDQLLHADATILPDHY
jgi:hypothetical protein